MLPRPVWPFVLSQVADTVCPAEAIMPYPVLVSAKTLRSSRPIGAWFTVLRCAAEASCTRLRVFVVLFLPEAP